MNTSGKFAHRENYDSSFDSICLSCYLTIATAENEAMLSDMERSHSCNDSIVTHAHADDALAHSRAPGDGQ